MASTIGNVTLGESGRLVERHWQELNARRKMYTALGLRASRGRAVGIALVRE